MVSLFSAFLPFCLILIYLQKNRKLLRFCWLVFITALMFHLVSSNGTYNSWYNAPIFPLLSILVGTGLGVVFYSLKSFVGLKKVKYFVFSIAFVLTIFYYPYKEIILNECYFKEHKASYEIYGEYLNKLKKEKPGLKDFFVYYGVMNRHFLFYRNVYNDKYGYSIRSCGSGVKIADCTESKKAKVGDKVMVCEKGIKEAVLLEFAVDKIDSYKECELFLITSLKAIN